MRLDSFENAWIKDEVPDKSQKGAEQPKGSNQRIVLKALVKTLGKSGRTVLASDEIPEGALCVDESLWQECAVNMLSGELKARKQTFKRAAESLQANGFVSQWGKNVWIRNEPKTVAGSK
jgi:hypothetical protein